MCNDAQLSLSELTQDCIQLYPLDPEDPSAELSKPPCLCDQPAILLWTQTQSGGAPDTESVQTWAKTQRKGSRGRTDI